MCRKWLIFNTQLFMGKSFLQVKHLNSWRCCVVWKNFLANLICIRYAENIFDCFQLWTITKKILYLLVLEFKIWRLISSIGEHLGYFSFLLVSRTGTVGWTERCVKVAKCVLAVWCLASKSLHGGPKWSSINEISLHILNSRTKPAWLNF